MTNDELNKYILHYLTEDKTHSAIMLTGAWGIGKSYYIQNELIPYLQAEKNGKHKCIVISLYGLKDLYEISKALYLESKFKILNGSSEKAVTGKFAAKTVLKGITSFFGIDLSKTEEEMKALYDSVDLSGQLIILEDLERSGVDTLEILGYVNNLVEQDGVRVLLVANENELLKYITSEPDEDGKTQTIPDENTKEYLRKKEKTVSDTILFNGNFESALENILHSFNNSTINLLLSQKDRKGKKVIISEILKVIDTVGSNNLRSIIFGCQKTVDIYQKTPDEYDIDFLKLMLCGSIAFSLRWKNNSEDVSNTPNNYSPHLGTSEFPLLRSMYDYMVNQKIDNDLLNSEYNTYCAQKTFDKAQTEIRKKLEIIYSFPYEYEKTVVDGLKTIASNLEKTEDIPVYEYGKLANYLVAISHVIGCKEDVNRCRQSMVNHLLNIPYDAQLENNISFHDGIELDSQEQRIELSNWENEMIDAIRTSIKEKLAFDYNPKNVEAFYRSTYDNISSYIKIGRFASLFDANKTIEFLKESSPKQIDYLRRAFLSVYNFSNIGDYLESDKNALIKLNKEIDSLIKQKTINDKIVLRQLVFFSGNLRAILKKMGINEID